MEALRWIGPLTAHDLKGVLEDPEIPLTCIAYHLSVLARQGLLCPDGERVGAVSVETLYYFPARL